MRGIPPLYRDILSPVPGVTACAFHSASHTEIIFGIFVFKITVPITAGTTTRSASGAAGITAAFSKIFAHFPHSFSITFFLSLFASFFIGFFQHFFEFFFVASSHPGFTTFYKHLPSHNYLSFLGFLL
ncbi:hypothetical protein DXA95_12210 [Odoribacter sp. OF09-27XD]|nr:hypothetical protein DXA95_12210 [Odoribacter sp. OF09-27XD]